MVLQILARLSPSRLHSPSSVLLRKLTFQNSVLPHCLLISQSHIVPKLAMSTNGATSANIKTAILMMNMGGPESDKVEDVERFLLALFQDRDIIKMPFQNFLGPLIARRRAPKLKAKFDQIGGDPLHDWTQRQGKAIAAKLDVQSPSTGPHKAYTCFRYSRPDIEEAVKNLQSDGAERVVLLSKYPQYSCSTTGSSLNEIARFCEQKQIISEINVSQRWSLIDRWPTAPAIVDTYADLIDQELQKIQDPSIRDQIVLLFSAHSIPIWMVERGDDYTGEVGGTVQAVLSRLHSTRASSNPYSLVWQSKVGPVAWQGPQIEKAIEGYVRNGHKHFMIIPIAFVNEHIETLHELDIEYGQELKEKLHFETFVRVAAANESPKFINGLANLIEAHLKSNDTISAQMTRRCPGCTKENCKQTRAWLQKLDSINKQL